MAVFAVLAALVWIQPRGNAADPQYAVTTWQTEDGLPSDTVTGIAQTADGFLWVGTTAGLARFDGVRFVPVRSVEGLAGASIRRLFADRSGDLWIATEDSRVFRRREGRIAPMALPGMVKGRVTSLAQDPEGSVWCSTDLGGALRFRGDRFEWVFPEVSSVRMPTQLVADVWGDGALWFRRGMQLGCFQGTNWTEVTRDGAPAERLGPMTPRRGGGVWIFAAERRLDVLGRGRWPVESRVYPPFMDPLCLLDDSGGRFWIGTFQQGLVRTGSGQPEVRLFTGTGFPIDAVNCLAEDREGNVWVGGSSGGLARVTRWNFVTPAADAGLPSSAPVCLTEDIDGAVWVVFAESGLWRLHEGRVTGPHGVSGANLRRTGWALEVGRDGTKWFGAYGVGLVALRGDRATLWRDKDGLPSNDIRALREGAPGELWLGTVLGLVRFDGTNFARVSAPHGWPTREVNSLARDRAGHLWVGTWGEGVGRWRDGTVEVLGVEQGLPSGEVRALLAGDDGSTWIGTTRGLAWWREGRIHAFDTGHGLPDADIHSIVDDGLGHLWLGTVRGVVRVERAELVAVAEGRMARLASVRSFGRDAGLPSVRLTRGQPAAIRARDGRLWFATLKGLAVVDPAGVRSNPVRPEVFLEEVLIDSEAVPRAVDGGSPAAAQRVRDESPLRVPSDARRLEFHYTTPMLTAPERVRFQRRLDGIDDDWRDAGDERIAVYHGLRAGQYRLRVRAANNDGVWGEEGASLPFSVAPVWWETVWFRVVGAIGFAGLLGGAFWLRLGALERRRAAQEDFARRLMAQQEAERKRIAAELHDSLGQSLSIIQNRAVLAARAGDAGATATAHLAGISESATEALAGVREICQGLRPVELDRLGLTKTLQSVSGRLAASSGLTVVAEIDPVDGLVATEHWIHVLRFVQEGLNNVVKHARATEVTVTLREDERWLRLVIADNGVGMGADAGSMLGGSPGAGEGVTARHRFAVGLGLTTLQERARILGAELAIDSIPVRGTTLRLTFPVMTPDERPVS